MSVPCETGQFSPKPVELIPITSTTGHLLYIPRQSLDAIERAGGAALTIEIGSRDGEWVTMVEAANQLINDVDGINLAAAKMRVKRAVDSGGISSRKEGRSVRLDPVSLKAWRLDQREQNLAESD